MIPTIAPLLLLLYNEAGSNSGQDRFEAIIKKKFFRISLIIDDTLSYLTSR
jgi:hypothetical protein